jgi:DNA-binding transcriptional regulator GbsR (MarR family)
MKSKKENFIEFVKVLMDNAGYEDWDDEIKEGWSDALDYWNGLQITGDSNKPKFTENGKLILQYMKDNKDVYNNLFKAKDIGEGMGISSRTVSGAIRKLVTDAFVEKIGESPICYSLTTLGVEVNLDEADA